MNPSTVESLEFTPDPPASWVAKDTEFTAAVTAYDHYGNPVPGHDVTISLDLNPGGATLTCVNPSLVYRYDGHCRRCIVHPQLNKDSVGYTLKAEGSRARTATSSTSPTRSRTVRTRLVTRAAMTGAGSTTNTNVSNFTGQAAVAVDGSLQADLNLCGGSSVQVGPGTVFESVNQDQATGTWTITTQVAKSALVDPSREPRNTTCASGR